MNIWKTRIKSIKWLDNEFKKERDLIQEGYHLLDKCVDIFEEVSLNDGNNDSVKFARVSGAVIVKANNLSLACYSLVLDGLAQEGGAVLRPLIETFELLVYLKEDWKRVDEVLNDTLPSAGEIAKKIEGFHKDARDYLNNYSSHFSFTHYSMSHVFDFESGKFKRLPTHGKKVFLSNIRTINTYQIFVIMESISCLHIAGVDVTELANKAELYRDKSVDVFSQHSNDVDQNV